MFTYKLFVNAARKNALTLRITYRRQKAELSLGFCVSEDELAGILSGEPSVKNRQLASLVAIWLGKIEEIKFDLLKSGRAVEGPKAIMDLVQAAFFGREPRQERVDDRLLFAKYFTSFAESKTNERTKSIYLATMSRMVAYDPDLAEKRFEDITIRWLTDFDDFLMMTSPSQNARNIHFRNIRAVINAAIDDELTSHYPFRRFKIRPTPTKKRSLSVETIQRIFGAEECLEAWEMKYLDFFKLSFMLIGINVVDMCGLSEIVDGRIDYIRAKTHKPYSVKVEPEAMSIIERHRGQKGLLDFAENYTNYRHFYQNLCVGLRSIRDKMGLKELTSYWARHSWATIAASLDIPKDTIAHALGHGGNTVTDIYIDFDQRKVDEANRRVLDWVLYGRR